MGAYPALWTALAFVGGVALAPWLPRWGWGWAAVVAASAALAWGVRRRGLGRRGVFLLAGVAALGVWRWQVVQPDFDDLSFIGAYAGWKQEATVVGVLTEPPDIRDTYANLRLQVERLRFAGEHAETPVHGLLLVRTTPEAAQPLRYGTRVVVSGWLTLPPSGERFSWRDYLARQGIFVTMKARRLGVLAWGQGSAVLGVIYALRARAAAVVRQLWPDPEAALLGGILLGLDKGIPRAVYDAFRVTGTAHIIAISGFNITILAGLFVALFGRLLGKARGMALAALAVVGYTILVGASAAVVRAAIMGLLGMAALGAGRRQHAYTTLAVTAAFMAALDPRVLGDVGFQLSFAATLGLVIFAEPFQQAAERVLRRWLPPRQARRWAAPVGEFFLFTLAAQLLTLPISAYAFHRISVISFLANPAVLPVQAPLMIGAGVAVLLGLLWLPLGQAVAWAVWPLAAYTIRAVEAFAALPFTTVAAANFGVGGVAAYYAALAAGVGLWRQRERWLARWRLSAAKAALLPALAVMAMLTWHAGLTRPDGRLHLALLPVGNGAALLVHTPTGRWVLVGGGESGTALTEALGRTLPLGARLDWWVVGATRSEMVEALLPALASEPPRAVWWAGAAQISPAARALQARLQDAGVPVQPVLPGAALALGDGARLQALAVSPRGGVFLLQWRDFRMLLPLGMDFDALAQLERQADRWAPLTALLLADGGYAPLNPPEWIARWRPRLLLLSVRPADPHGRPSLELLQSVRGFPLVRTDRCGRIALTTDGSRLWVHTARPCSP